MSLKTFSAFIYGHDVTQNNQSIDFSEDGSNILLAQVKIGSYSLSDFVNAVSVALNEAGDNDYTVTVDRATRLITIASSGNLWLYPQSGPRSSISLFPLIGFNLDKSGLSSYIADIASGNIYEPQYKLQKYVDFDDFVEANDSSVNVSASGIVEVVSFGETRFMECNITYITDITGQGVIKNNPSGVSDLRQFMLYATKKKPLEFIADIDTPSQFVPCILEKTRTSSKGTGFQLFELYSRGLANYYETGQLTFRKV